MATGRRGCPPNHAQPAHGLPQDARSAAQSPRAVSCGQPCAGPHGPQTKRRPQICPRGRRRSQDACQRWVIQRVPNVHSWDRCRPHEHHSAWACRLATRALASMVASPSLFVCARRGACSPASPLSKATQRAVSPCPRAPGHAPTVLGGGPTGGNVRPAARRGSSRNRWIMQ